MKQGWRWNSPYLWETPVALPSPLPRPPDGRGALGRAGGAAVPTWPLCSLHLRGRRPPLGLGSPRAQPCWERPRPTGGGRDRAGPRSQPRAQGPESPPRRVLSPHFGGGGRVSGSADWRCGTGGREPEAGDRGRGWDRGPGTWDPGPDLAGAGGAGGDGVTGRG